jgi:hypothetical protein
MSKDSNNRPKGQNPGDIKIKNLAMEIPKRPDKPKSANEGKKDSGKK